MSIASRISKKTFFAAAALGLAAAVPAHAYLFEDEVDKAGGIVYDGFYENYRHYNVYILKNTYLQTSWWNPKDFIVGNTPAWLTFVKTGSGTAQMNLGAEGYLYNQHLFGYSDDNKDDNDGPVYKVTRRDGSVPADAEYEIEYYTAGQTENILEGWQSGEIVVDRGTLALGGFVNMWYDFGNIINPREIGQATGKMVGVSRITVRNGATLDISANNSFVSGEWTALKGMVASNSLTTLQFLNNLQAGDLGTDLNSELVLGSASAYHVNLNVGGWEENTRVDTGVTLSGNLTSTYFDTQLAFGGSIGRISGAGSIYKTGKGTFTILNSSEAFSGSLYAAGGSLVLAGNDTGAKTKTFTDGFGNNVRVRLSSSVGNAASVNIAGTMNTGKEASGGSMQGAAIGSSVYSIYTKTTNADLGEELVVTAVKEAFFTTPEAGTLVIAENQTIKNLQSYFNAGLAVNAGTSAADAVLNASVNEGVLAPKGNTTTAERGTSDAPIIAGTGIGSKIVIPGGNYTLKDGNFVQNVDANGYMQGGVLVVNQAAGMGGVYQGSVVGARVSIYNKNTFETNTENDQTTASLSNADRLKAALVAKNTIKTDLGLSDADLAALNIGADGSFALDNPVAWKVVNYYKQTTLDNAYYVDYKADDTVTGGLLVLEGAGDLALLLETANYSGIYIDPNRTGKTVLNVSTVNSLPGSTVSLGGRGIVSFVATQGSTLNVKLSGFVKGSQLVFATEDTVQTVSGVVSVGGNRQADIGFAQIQDGIYGDIFIESGIGLNLSGNESVFANADTVTLWKGKAWKQENAAPTLTLFPKGSVFASQVVNDLTGDSSAEILLGNGILTTVVSDNGVDLYSGLSRGSYAGKIIGSGSIIKDGAGTFTLSGGENNRNFTGTTEIAVGKLSVTRKNSLTGTSAVIFNEGTVAEMIGDQKIRTLYGSAGTSVTVDGKLTLGANITPAAGENRALVTNNLGLGSVAAGATDASFARFKNCFDLEGNLVLKGNAIGTLASQKDATEKYLTATAKLAYSGFDASALEKFVGVDDYDGRELLSQADYDALKAFAENGGTGTAVNGVAQSTLLADLAEKYATLATEANYLKIFAPTGTVGEYEWYSPAGLKSLMSDRDYKLYVSEQLKAEVEAEYGKSIPAMPTSAEKNAINQALFKVLRTKYETLSSAQLDAKLAANPEAMFAEFKTAKNLAGTPLMSVADIAAVDALLNAENPDTVAIKAAYEKWSTAYEAIQNKKLFAGISVPGAFAAQVTVGGNLTDTSWISEPSFAGTLTTGTLVKTGDSTVDLTGKLFVNSLIVESGLLSIEGSSLAAPVSGGISVSRNAELSVNVNADPEDTENVGIVFNQSVSGDGNFVKTGDGKLTLGKDVLYTGTTTIAGGTLEMTLREAKTTVVDGVSKTILPQSHITFSGNDTALILNQTEDVVWAGEIKASNGVTGAALSKIGDGELTIGGDVALGTLATISVDEGTLNLSSITFGQNSNVKIGKGAALSLGKSSVGGSVRFSGEGALRIAGEISLDGSSIADDNEKFVGAVTVLNGGSLSLGGMSVFSDAKLMTVNTGATLSIKENSTQLLTAIAGTGTLSLGAGSTLELSSSESRIGMAQTAGFYTFSEESLLAVPDFSGSVAGAGTLSVVGGASSFSGAVDANVSVRNGGQVVLNAVNFGGNNTPDKTSKVTVDGADSEVVFLVSDAGTANLSTGAIVFTSNGGKFGKVGNGTLSVSHNDFANCNAVSVYDGTLNISGWVGAKKTIASGATLSMTVGDTEPDFSTVYGSGTLELTATKDVTLSPDKVNVSGSGDFFNGEIRFTSSGTGYKVTLAKGTNTSQMVAVGTSSGVSLSVEDVTFIQSQNSEIAGDLEVSGTVTVQGLDAKNGNSGRVLSSEFRTLTVSGDYTHGNSEFKMANIGFGFKSTEADMAVVIDKSSIANAFIVDLAQDSGTLVAAGTTIDVDAKINDAEAASALKELSVIKTGENATFTISAATIANDLGRSNTPRDSVFGISRDVYSVLEDNNGLLNLGVGEGNMVVEWNDDSETLTTANGVNVDLVTLRDAASGNSGTLTIKSTASSSRALAAGTQVFAETVRGGGNVMFDGTTGNGLIVSAKQEYLGQTEIVGNVEFSGAGRHNASSQLTVAGDSTLHGGVNMTGRDVSYSVSAVRNADDTGAAGTTTLTIALSDARLASDIKAQVKVRANGTLDTATWEILGTPPAGVTIDPASLKLEDGVLTLTATDSGLNESYAISVNTGALPGMVGEGSSIAGKTTVAGNVILESSSGVVLNATEGDSISVGAGRVTIKGGSSIYVENLGTETLGKTLKLVSAGTVDGSVVAALRKANEGRPDAEKMKLAVYTDANGDVCARMIIDNFSGLGADYNEGVSDSFLGALSEIASWNGANIIDVDSNPTLTGVAKDLFFALNSLPASRLAEEVEKLSPISFASMLAMPTAAFNSDVARIHGRLDQRRYDGADPLRDSGEYEFFALAQSDFAENGTASDAPNFDYNLYGVTAGFDWKPNYETTLGFALGYTYGKAKIQNGGGKINMDDMRATAFASRLFGNSYVDVGVQAGTATFDTRRQTFAGSVSGDTDSVFAGTFVTVGSVFSIWQDKKDGSGLYFTPSVGLSYLHTEIDGFTESGTSGLNMDDTDGDSLRARIAAALQWAFPLDSWQVRLGVEVAYSHDFLGEELDMTGRFAAVDGSKFSTSGKALPTDIFSFGPTVDIMVSERSSLYFGYGIDVDTDSGVSQNINAGFRHRF